LEPFCFVLFGDFIPKGENVGPKQAKLFQSGKRQAMSEHRKKRSKRGKCDPGGVWMMVSIQASVSGSNFVNFCKFMLAFVVLSKITKKGEIVANMASYAISSSMILVIHDNMINGTNHVV
jgi:hypothetical protein